MRWFRRAMWAVAGLAVIALGCAALCYAAPWVAGAAWSVALLVIASATLAAMIGKESHRRFWRGVVVFGWVYVVVALGPLAASFERLLLTNSLLNHVARKLPQAMMDEPDEFQEMRRRMELFNSISKQIASGGPSDSPFGRSASAQPSGSKSVENSTFISAFVQVGHAIFTVLLALLGGLIGRFLSART